ncbi:MAG: hypothetical protein WDN48_15845 [Pseudolabrys sp.]
MQNTYKPFPCGVVLHPVIEGCAALSTANRLEAKDVRRIALRCNPLVLELTGIKKPAATLEAKLSVFHAAAAAVVKRRGTLEEFALATINNPDVLALREKVAVIVDQQIGGDEADITIELDDGRVLNCHVDHAIGSISRPLTDRDMSDKFRGLTEPLLQKSQVDGLIEACGDMRHLKDASVLARLAAG